MTEPEYNYGGNEFEEVEQQVSPQRQQDILESRLSEKKNYLRHLKTTSKQLAQQIKDINEELDRRMSKLAEKQLVKKPSQAKVPADPENSRQLQERYRELDSIRQQIKKIKAKEFNMQFAVDRVKELKGQLKLEQQEVDRLNRDFTAYKKAMGEQPQQKESESDDRAPIYTDEISRLKDKIKEITSQRQQQTEEILEMGRKQKYNRQPGMDRSKSTPKKMLLDATLVDEVSQARKKYEEIGRKLEILRVRRNILLQEDSHLQERTKLLQSYQSKYGQLKKLHNSQLKAHKKNMAKAEQAPSNEQGNLIAQTPELALPQDTTHREQKAAKNTCQVDIQQSLPTP